MVGGMQLMNGPETTLLKDLLTGAGGPGPPMSRTEMSLICSAESEARKVYTSTL
jgi:hypothetical protein